MNPVRVRLAPSPTGQPHLGLARTAIFDALLARQSGGALILRIEDTDKTREVPGTAAYIAESLQWLGLEPTEGVYLAANGEVAERGEYGPYTQSLRLPIYHEHADKLLASGHAYRCFCSTERLTELREQQQANHQPPRYDGHCRHLVPAEVEARVAAGEPFVIRHAVPADEAVPFVDAVRGEIIFQSNELDDYVLIKTDGYPTYQLANVVDDHLMKISHVLRGDEWIPSTPKNLLLYKAFGWEPPIFAHVPVILGPDRKHKLSKRDGAEPILTYRDRGYLPEAIISFLVFLGWSPGTEAEFLRMDELVAQFRLEKVQKSPAVFDFERLDYVNGWFIRQLPIAELVEMMRPYLDAAGLTATPEYVEAVAKTVQERMKRFNETVELTEFFFKRPTVAPEIIIPKKGDLETTKATLAEVVTLLTAIPADAWAHERIEADLRAFIETTGRKSGEVLWPVRAALTGAPTSPGAFEMLSVLGRDESLARLQAVLA